MREKKGLITEYLTDTNIVCWREIECRIKTFYNVEGTTRGFKKVGNGIIKRLKELIRQSGVTEFS